MRSERDIVGTVEVPAGRLFGPHTARALDNFPLSLRPVRPDLIHAYGAVKLAACNINRRLGFITEQVGIELQHACMEMMDGALDAHIVVDALQGGAGTSTNMNVNEVLANRTLQRMGYELGQYEIVDPLRTVNLHQSTNDTYPTALKIALIKNLRRLETEVIALMEAFQEKEKDWADIVKVGRTQFQDAVLTTLGREMSAYAEALSRDRWRIYKCEERLRVVNLGGTAIGTGIGAPRDYIFQVVPELKEITGLGLARAENLVEATQNSDVYVEVSGIIKACAVSLYKMSNDLRFMSSGPQAGIGEITLPPVQAGSSIMPGKINPVIPEAVMQAAVNMMSNDVAVTQACSAGHLELNAFLPLVADKLLESLSLLRSACRLLKEKCVDGMKADEGHCRAGVNSSTAAITALVSSIGYKEGEQLAIELQARHTTSLRDLVVEKNLMSAEEYDELTSAEAVNKLGH